jgi:PHD/YefM family antitoxin component YafN of YafNO toxin-antitoxin module
VAILNEKYVVNENGERVSVLLDWEDYQGLLEELEELESIRAYDAAKAAGDESVPFEKAMEEIENKRQ